MTTFKLRKLHRQRTRRRNTAKILDHGELARLLDVPEDQLQAAIELAGWDYHRDARGRLWASLPESLLAGKPGENPQENC